MADVHQDLHRALAPHAARMQQDIEGRWPERDAERALIQWLSDRHRVQRPKDLRAATVGSRASQGGQQGQKLLQEEAPPRLREVVATSQRGHFAAAALATRGQSLISAFTSGMKVPASGFKGTRLAGEKYSGEPGAAVQEMSQSREGRERVEGALSDLRAELRCRLIASVPLLSSREKETGQLLPEEQRLLAERARLMSFRPGEMLVKEGGLVEEGAAPRDSLYIVQQGVCEVLVEGCCVSQLRREDCFGELAMAYRRPPASTVKARTAVSALALLHEDLRAVLSSSEQRQRLETAARLRLLAGCPLLWRLGPRQRQLLLGLTRSETFPAGTKLLLQGATVGEAMRCMYILEEGRCREDVRAPGLLRGLAVPVCGTSASLSSGCCFGMLSMFYGCPNAVSVTAETRVRLLSLGYSDLMAAVCADEDGKELLESIQKSIRCHLLCQCSLLDPQAPGMLEQLVEHAEAVVYRPMEALFIAGERVEAVYVLEEGCLVEHGGDSASGPGPMHEHLCVRHTLAGDLVGEGCLKTRCFFATTTVVASSLCRVLRLREAVLRSAASCSRTVPQALPHADLCRLLW